MPLTVVVKVGGSLLGEGVSPDILSDLRDQASKSKLIIVHGGGKEVTQIAGRLGVSQKFVFSPGGIRSRYTDRETIDVFTMVMAGRINKQMVSQLQREGVNAFGVSGLDGRLIRAERKKKLIVVEGARKRIIDGGYTGKIQTVNAELLKMLFNAGYVPVISPVATSEEFDPLNVDGDRAAAYVAGSIPSESVIFLTDVPGVIVDGKVVQKLNLTQARQLMPKMGPGMEKKVMASIEALEMHVQEAIIASGSREKPITQALKHQECTVITHE
jgi:acetylglutamate/LysW-gamma-L-alpha-aminoadipate kinase